MVPEYSVLNAKIGDKCPIDLLRVSSIHSTDASVSVIQRLGSDLGSRQTEILVREEGIGVLYGDSGVWGEVCGGKVSCEMWWRFVPKRSVSIVYREE